MAEEREVRRVSRDAAAALDYTCRALLDCLRQVDTSIESMDLGFALQARCLEAVALGNLGERHCVVPVPRDIDERVASACLGLRY